MRIAVLCALAMSANIGLEAQTTPTQPVIKVTLLGTGVPLLDPAAYTASGRVTAGLLVEAGTERMLFDCGQGILTRLLQSGGSVMNPNAAVDKVFISHLHSDHIADLAAIYAYGWLYRYDDPLKVWGPGPGPNQPVGISSMMQLMRLTYDTDFYVRSTLFTILAFPLTGVAVDSNVVELWPDVVYTNNGVKVTAFLVDHHPVAPAYGFRIDYQGKSVVFSGDTTYTTNLVQAAKGADVLINEIWGYPPDPELYAYHCPPETCAAPMFMQAAPKMAVFTHMGIPPGTTAQDLVDRTRKAGYQGPLTIGQDLMVINVNSSGVQITPPAPGASSAPVTLPEMQRSVSLPAEMRVRAPVQ